MSRRAHARPPRGPVDSPLASQEIVGRRGADLDRPPALPTKQRASLRRERAVAPGASCIRAGARHSSPCSSEYATSGALRRRLARAFGGIDASPFAGDALASFADERLYTVDCFDDIRRFLPRHVAALLTCAVFPSPASRPGGIVRSAFASLVDCGTLDFHGPFLAPADRRRDNSPVPRSGLPSVLPD